MTKPKEEEMSAVVRFFDNQDVLHNVFQRLEDHEIRNVFTVGGQSLPVGLDILHTRKSVPRDVAMKWGVFGFRSWGMCTPGGRYIYHSSAFLGRADVYRAAVRSITVRDPIAIRPYTREVEPSQEFRWGRMLESSLVRYLQERFPRLQHIFTPDDSASPWPLPKRSFGPPEFRAVYAYRVDLDAKTLDIQEDIFVARASDAWAKYYATPASVEWPSFKINHKMSVTFGTVDACTGPWLSMIGSDTRISSASITETGAIVNAEKLFAEIDKRTKITGNQFDTIALGDLSPDISAIRKALEQHVGSRRIKIDPTSDEEWYRGDSYVDKHPEWDGLGMEGQLRVVSSVMDPPPLDFCFQIVNHVYRFHSTIPNALVECRLPYKGNTRDLHELARHSGPTLTRLQIVGMPTQPLNLANIVSVIRTFFPALRHLDFAWARGYPSEDRHLYVPHAAWQGSLETLTLRMEDRFRQSTGIIGVAKVVASLCSKDTKYLITGDHHVYPNLQNRNGCHCVLCRDFEALMRWLLSLPTERAKAVKVANFKELEVHHLNGLRRWEQLEFDDEDKPIPLISLDNLALIDKLFEKRDGNGPRTAIQAERTLAHIRARLRDDPKTVGSQDRGVNTGEKEADTREAGIGTEEQG